MPLTMPETRVLEIWQSSLRHRTDLVTEDNVPVRIIYPGRPNDGRGADLRDAVIATGRGLVKGDIEIHVKSSAWWAHGHHADPAYNPVILHVVYQHDAGKPTMLQNGAAVPTLSLIKYTEESRDEMPPLPLPADGCRNAGRIHPDDTADRLDAAGEARFLSRVANFQPETAAAGPEQALYRGVMTALGYSKNKEAMAALAGCVTLRELEEITSGAETDYVCLERVQSKLLGTAGLLPSQRPARGPPRDPAGAYEKMLERYWNNRHGTAPMSMDDWQFYKVRPGNFPVRRIAGMGCLLVRYRRQGFLNGLKIILETLTGEGNHLLEDALLVNAEGYWSSYMDFGVPVNGTPAAPVGKERSAEITVNVLLPFFTAYARTTSQPELAQKALNIFRRYRAPAENSLEKHMRQQLGLASGMVATARRRQGLLHIYKTLCTQGKCAVCPLGK